MIPTGRAALLLALGALCAWAFGDPWTYLAALVVVVALLVVLDGLLAGAVGDLAFARDGAALVRLGDSADVQLTVANTGVRPARLKLRDAWVPSAGATPFQHETTVPAGGQVTLVTTLRPTRRGDRPAARVTPRSYGPLGLAYRQPLGRTAQARTPAWTLRVLPRFESRKLLPEKITRLRVIDGQVAVRGRGQGTEFDSLREYVLGDDVRSIDWRGTARRSDVVVRTWRPERDRRVFCVLDTGRTCAARVGDEPRLEESIDAALLLGALASHTGDQVDLLAVDTAVRASVRGGSTRTVLHRLVMALAPLEPALVETDFGLAVGEILRRQRRRALVVLFTALEPGALGEGLLPVLSQLAARHTVVVAAVSDPELERLAASRGGTDEVYTAAGALRTLAERDRVKQALVRRGVTVVDAPAGQFAGRVADTYLALKAAGKL
ncbi:MAG TPA: DUF58 domain-containing protein [Rugosimonospora sp.]|nr:DUF58 domain-containing protein [Rugosimonospora sp.]